MQKKYCALRLPRPEAGKPVKPWTRTASPSAPAVTGSMPSAVSRPSRAYTALSARPSPGVKNSSRPSRMQRTETSGRPSAQRRAAWRQAAPSARSLLRNLRRAGVLKNSPRTEMLVPSGAPSGRISIMSPASRLMYVPSAAPCSQVLSSMRETLEMAASASPRKPSVSMRSSPRSSASLLVAWRRKATPASSALIPQPSSVTRISSAPPPENSTVMFLAPASTAFSASSLTADAGRSTTSPAAMRSATWGESMFILGIGPPCLNSLPPIILQRR